MKTFKAPLIPKITLSNIGDYLCTQYGVKKGELGDFLYQNAATFRKKANGSRPIQPEDTLHLEHAITEKICNNKTDEYFKLLKRWFPELRSYTDESEIRAIISANILGQTTTKGLPSFAEGVFLCPSKLAFFQYCLNYSSPIKTVKMAYHTGWRWFHNSEDRTLLKELLNQNIVIQIIANSSSPQLNDIIFTMRDPAIAIDYTGVNETLADWHKYEKAYPNLSPEKFVMLHIPADKNPIKEQTWIYSVFEILENNRVSLKTNISNPANCLNNGANYEYYYEGKLQVTGKIIYVSLYDENKERHITISISKPDHINNRYIGIMSSLNHSGNAPTALKCAFFTPTIISNVNLNQLHEILLNNNQLYHDSLMILESQDTDFFYSNWIFNN